MITQMSLLNLSHLNELARDMGQVIPCTVMTGDCLPRWRFSTETSVVCDAFAAVV